MTARFLSAGKYMLDAFAISLVLVYFTNETDLPLALIWLSSSFAATVTAFVIFTKWPYQLWMAIAISSGTMLAAVFFGAPGWLLLLLTLLSLYRMHARFSVIDDGTNADGNFLLLFVLLFCASLVLDLFSPLSDSSRIIFSIVVSAVLFYVLFRLAYRYLSSRKQGAKASQALAAAFTVLGVSGILSFLVFLAADEARRGAALLLSGILRLVLWPFSGLMEKLTDYLSGLSTEPELEAVLEKMGPDENEEQAQEMIQSTGFDFPAEIFMAAVLLAAVITLIFWLKKVKAEKETAKPENRIAVERFPITPGAAESKSGKEHHCDEMDLQLVREVFRDFAQEAAAAGKGRQDFETVKEWTDRLQWPVTENFFHTYNLVRYGFGSISAEEARPFINEIQILKEKFLKKDV